MHLRVGKRAAPAALAGAPTAYQVTHPPGLRVMAVWWSLNLVALVWTVGLAVVWPRATGTVPPAWAIATNVALFLLPELVVLVWLSLARVSTAGPGAAVQPSPAAGDSRDLD